MVVHLAKTTITAAQNEERIAISRDSAAETRQTEGIKKVRAFADTGRSCKSSGTTIIAQPTRRSLAANDRDPRMWSLEYFRTARQLTFV